MRAFFHSALFLVLATTACHAFLDGGLKIEGFFEQRCSPEKGFVTHNFENWIANLTEGTPLYIPLSSSADVLRITQDLFKEVDLGFLNQEDVLNSCITVQVTGLTLTFYGYCGETFSKELTQVAPLVFKFTKPFPSGLGGVIRISLTDNHSWQILDVCWADSQRSFAVVSLHPYLSACTRKVIVEHLKAIGFDEKYFTGLTYDYESCEYTCRRQHAGHGQAHGVLASTAHNTPIIPSYLY